MRDITTIGIHKATRLKLEDLKIHERETFDDLLNRILEEMDHLKTQIKKKQGKNKSLAV